MPDPKWQRKTLNAKFNEGTAFRCVKRLLPLTDVVADVLSMLDHSTARISTHGPVRHAMVSFLQLDIASSGCNTVASILYARGPCPSGGPTDLLLDCSITVKGRNCLHALPNAARLLRGGATCDAAWDASQPWLLYRSKPGFVCSSLFQRATTMYSIILQVSQQRSATFDDTQFT